MIRATRVGGLVVNTTRAFSTTAVVRDAAAEAAKKQKKQDEAIGAKVRARHIQKKKQKMRQAPELHPLYMEVPVALRYLRAAEVGNPAKKTTISMQFGLVSERGSKPLNGSVVFPRPVKESSVMILSLDESVLEAARAAGATVTGGAELIDKIDAKELDLDQITTCYATPDIVPQLSRVAKRLGPKGLFPSVKQRTVDADVVGLMRNNLGAHKFKQKEDKLSVPIGRCDFSDKEIIDNIKAASKAIYDLQPPGTKKPVVLGQCHLSSTLGPSVVINVRN